MISAHIVGTGTIGTGKENTNSGSPSTKSSDGPRTSTNLNHLGKNTLTTPKRLTSHTSSNMSNEKGLNSGPRRVLKRVIEKPIVSSVISKVNTQPTSHHSQTTRSASKINDSNNTISTSTSQLHSTPLRSRLFQSATSTNSLNKRSPSKNIGSTNSNNNSNNNSRTPLKVSNRSNSHSSRTPKKNSNSSNGIVIE